MRQTKRMRNSAKIIQTKRLTNRQQQQQQKVRNGERIRQTKRLTSSEKNQTVEEAKKQ